ncbi:MAG: phytoene/squalene synthase family protein [Pseudomonadota bacterium]
MIAAEDRDACLDAIKTGSHSFYAASRLLPPKIRERSVILYAFCRLADDSVDLTQAKSLAVAGLRTRLELAYEGTPADSPADRAFTALASEVAMPKALPEALLEGLAWDADGRCYDSLEDLHGYCARVASAVGVMMCVVMGVRDRDVLARACDLGVAMQLTNIARDVGEDAAAGRLYMPLNWLRESGLDPEAFLADPQPVLPVRDAVSRLLVEAERLYRRSEAGIGGLPASCRIGIFAARQIYARIGTHVGRAGHDSISRRAKTSQAEKLALLFLAFAQATGCFLMPNSPRRYAPPLDATAFLVDAAAGTAPDSAWGDGKPGTVLSILAQLKQKDRSARYA